MTGLLTVFCPRDPNGSAGSRRFENMDGSGEHFRVTVELLIQEPCGAPVTLDAAVWRVQSRVDATLLDHETPQGIASSILGGQLHARTLPGQRAEAAIGVGVLNRMIDQARPNSVRAA